MQKFALTAEISTKVTGGGVLFVFTQYIATSQWAQGVQHGYKFAQFRALKPCCNTPFALKELKYAISRHNNYICPPDPIRFSMPVLKMRLHCVP